MFQIYSNIKFHENPSIESQAVPSRRTEMTTLIVTFRSFVNTPKMCLCLKIDIYLKQECTHFPKLYELPQNSWSQKGDTKQDAH